MEASVLNMGCMEFDSFCEVMEHGIATWLPDDMKDAEIRVKKVTKNNNMQLTGLTIMKPGCNIAPTIYLDGYFEKYQCGAQIIDLMQEIVDFRVKSDVNAGFDTTQITNFENCKDKIFPRLINKKMNQKRLFNMPHGIFEDLAIVYYVELGDCEDGTMSCAITHQLTSQWGIAPEELYELAMSNLDRENAGTFTSMAQVMQEMMGSDVLIPDDGMLFVLTNKKKVNGAIQIFNRNLMNQIVSQIGGDFYIIPSSIHECLIARFDENMEAEMFNSMIREVNSTQVNDDEVLSDHVYRYSLERGIYTE